MLAARTLAVALFLTASSAFAAPDLSASIAAPTGVSVYASARYWVNVKNVGNTTSAGGSLLIDLPKTHTSPEVYILGTLGAFSSGCSRSGARITCPVPSTKKGVTRGFYFDLAVPQNSAPVVFRAEIVPAVADNALNNVATSAPAYVNPAYAIAGSVDVDNRHCTGTGLTSFFECELFPSSIATHVTTLEAGGNVLFASGVPTTYSGSWWQPAPNRLSFQYFNGTVLVADFNGYSVGGGCFEGVTTFPNSTGPYVSPYEVCITP